MVYFLSEIKTVAREASCENENATVPSSETAAFYHVLSLIADAMTAIV